LEGEETPVVRGYALSSDAIDATGGFGMPAIGGCPFSGNAAMGKCPFSGKAGGQCPMAGVMNGPHIGQQPPTKARRTHRRRP